MNEKMVARKANKTRKQKTKTLSVLSKAWLKGFLKLVVTGCLLGGIAAGIVYWDRALPQTLGEPNGPARFVPLEVFAQPKWVNEELEQKLYRAAAADGLGIGVDQEVARRVQRNIDTLFGWLADVRVRTMRDRLRVEGRWRRPLVLIEHNRQKFYVDRELVVLDYVRVPALTIVKAKGLSGRYEAPELGRPWRREDLAAAVELVALLNKWDRDRCPQKPLLREIAEIDVANYEGRKDPRQPQIVLYTKKGTEVIWGAALGKWQQNLEATDAEKLAKLYAYYAEYGTLEGQVKYINLRDPQNRIPLPIDRD